MPGIETVFASLPQFLLACLILAAAEAVYVLLGFGSGLIADGSLALLLPELRDAVVLLLLVNLPAELWVVRSSRTRISWRGVVSLFAGVAIGIPIGAWLLRRSDPRLLLTALGVLLVVVGAVFLVSRKPRRREHHPLVAPPVGLLSGVDKAAFRANLMAIFLLVTIVRVPTYAAFGLIAAPRLWSALAVMPAVLVGALIGNRVHLELEEETFRTGAILLLAPRR